MTIRTRIERLEGRLAGALSQAAKSWAFRVNAILTLDERARLADHIRQTGLEGVAMDSRDPEIAAILAKIRADRVAAEESARVITFLGTHNVRKR